METADLAVTKYIHTLFAQNELGVQNSFCFSLDCASKFWPQPHKTNKNNIENRNENGIVELAESVSELYVS